jgi:Tfp pilus assembly protein PilX
MRNNHSRHRRTGFVLMIVLVFLAIGMTLVVGWLRIAMLDYRQSRATEDRLQAEWLAESALERAGAKLLGDRSYQGENWQVSATDLGRPATVAERSAGGVVVIAVEPVPDRPTARRVHVQADFPAGEVAAPSGNVAVNRASKQTVFELPEPKTE